MSQLNVNTIGARTGTTVSIASGHTLSGITQGIKEYDLWRTTANTTGNNTNITAWGRPSGTLQGAYLGTGMSVDGTGYWTFPSTGIWKVDFVGSFVANADNYVEVLLSTSDDNFSTEDLIARTNDGNAVSTNGGAAISIQAILDITDTTNDKIEFKVDSVGSNSYLIGNSGTDYTTVSFLRLGDT